VRLTKIYGFIAIHVALVILFAFIFFLTRQLLDSTAMFLLAAALFLLVANGLMSGRLIKGLALPLDTLTRRLDGEARSLEEAAGRLNGTAQAMLDNSTRNSALVEEAASRLSQVSAILMRGAANDSEARDAWAEIAEQITHSSEILGAIDTNICLYTSSASDISAEAIQLAGMADELIAATGELSAIIHGTEAAEHREVSFKSRLARQMLVKALPLADAS
jgi:methyl-accepting chemotaxis protein